MKKHITLPLTLVAAAIIVGALTLVINSTGKSTSPELAQESVPAPVAEISVVSVTSDNTAAASASGSRIISWESKNFPSGGTVTINLIMKVSDNPTTYELVRTIAENTPNDGRESWTPDIEESENGLYIEVVCGSVPSTITCNATGAPVKVI